jgi:hypothetical protein
MHPTSLNIHIKHTLMDLKSEIDHNTVVLGDFSTPLSPIDRSSRWKINKEILELNNTIDLMDLTNIYSILQQHNTHSSQQPMELLQSKPYLRAQNMLQQIKENWNNPLNTVWPQHNETKI